MRGLGLVCLLIGSIGCIHDDLVQCGDGVACPIGLVCDDAHHGCTTQPQVDACTGLPDLAPCLTASTCHEGVCLPNDCGNGRVDPPEMCDDGNTTSGDGCSSDCSSTELCANGVVDLIRGEMCDDGNRRSHDGCNSLCESEQPRWRPLIQSGAPTLVNHSAVYDPERRRVVVFGGIGSVDYTDRTYEYDVDTGEWVDVSPMVSPSPRGGAAMAYDAAHHVVVLFGGGFSTAPLGDTWLWDGHTWRDVTMGMSPSPRSFGQMAYDSHRKQVVLFGGYPTRTTSNLTWIWDGEQWSSIDDPDAPPIRYGAATAYDPVHDEVVMYDGLTDAGDRIDGTWLWNGTHWRNVPDNAPGFHAEIPMAYDPVRGGMILSGYSNGDTYLWNGAAWSRVQASSPVMSGTLGYITWYDPKRATVLVQGGRTLSTLRSTVFEFLPIADSWAEVVAPTQPAPATSVGLAYDESHERVVRFGGENAGVNSSTTGELVDDGWIQRTLPADPPPRKNATLVYDAGHSQVLMFGGLASDDATWKLDETGWSIVAHGTPIRNDLAAAYDRGAGLVMLYGGNVGNGPLATTFAFDGTWQPVADGPARAAASLAYDEKSATTIMFGGDAPMPIAGDTWSWTSAAGWTKLSPVVVPSNRSHVATAYDPLRGEVVVFGGLTNGFPRNDSWRWDGTRWYRLDIETLPSARGNASMAYDRLHSRFIMFGPDTWVLQWTSAMSDELCITGVDRDGDGLAGCDDPDCAAICATCGNATCDPVESCRSCPADCSSCTPQCGDTFCDPGETAQSCPGDCP